MDGLKAGKIVLLLVIMLALVVGTVYSAVTIGVLVHAATGNQGMTLLCSVATSIALSGGSNVQTDRLRVWLFTPSKGDEEDKP